MNILVVKQTSLGDVLHSTGPVRTIRENYPDSHITLLTATSSVDVYRHNPHVDRIIVFDRYRIKREWFTAPGRSWRHIGDVMSQVRELQYDLAFDLQGRWKSVLFLYGARAGRSYVKGRWWGLEGYRRPEQHAIEEMNGTLRSAGLTVRSSQMEIFVSQAERHAIDTLLEELNPHGKKLVLMSPFTRWTTKNWPLSHFLETISDLPGDELAVLTGTGDDAVPIAELLKTTPGQRAVSVAGRLSLLEYAELVRRADVVLTGDSFPMHLACAQGTPVVALFGPTDEHRVGPVGDRTLVLRAPGCRKCYRRSHCRLNCVARITPGEALAGLARVCSN